jgi:aminopeptidase N
MRLACLFFTILLSFVATGQRNIDVLHYKYEIGLSDQTDSIKGKATITVKFTSPTSNLYFDFVQMSKGRMVMLAYAYMPDSIKTAIPVKSSPDKLQLELLEPAKTGDIETFVIEYKGIPEDGLIISKNKYGHRTFFADNWPNRGHNWLPCVDDPADKASVEFIVTAPQHYQVVANGIQVEETNIPGDKKLTHWKEDVPVSTKVMVIGVADFAVNLSGIVDGCIPVYSWVYPEDRKNGFHDYAQAAEILPFFIKNVGPYGYKKLANVESKTIFGGLENANTIFYSESSVTGTRKSEGLITHEIAHQWFGNMATEKTFAHLWLSEGFATYMTILYMENKYGADTARKMLLEDREKLISFARQNNSAVVDHTTDYMKLLNPNSYEKGSWVLHMLRRQLGDSVFWKSIRQYYAEYAGKTADTDDLRKVFEKLSGTDLSSFFKQWLFTPGIPELGISWKYDPAGKTISVKIDQLQKTGPYQFPLDISLGTGNIKEIKKLKISKQTEIFQWPVKERPDKITPDAAVSLLFSSRVSEEK